MDDKKAYIYIMTNKSFDGHDWVKIGYTKNVEKRRKQLSTTSLPYPYEVYATYEIPASDNITDKVLHKIITNLNPNLRLNINREFFEMTPQQAYDLLEGMAKIHNREDCLVRVANITEKPKINKKTKTESNLNITSVDIVKTDENKNFTDINSEILINGGKTSANYMKVYLKEKGLITNDEKVTIAKLNADIKKFWANPDVNFLKYNWLLILNDIVNKKLYFFRIPANSIKESEVKTRVHNGKVLIDVEIVHNGSEFICKASKIKYDTWLSETIKYD